MRKPGFIYVVLSSPPGPDCDLVEVEDHKGRSLHFNEWVEEGPYWVLALPSGEAAK